MSNDTWFDGLKHAEKLRKQGYSIKDLREYLAWESNFCGWQWDEWCRGFSDYIDNLVYRSSQNV